MTALAGGAAVSFFALAFTVLRVSHFEKLALPISFLVLILANANSAAHLYLSGDIFQTTNIIPVIFGAGFFVLSTPWFFATLLATIFSWFLAVVSLSDQSLFTHFAFSLVSACLISIVFHFVHVRDLADNYKLRLFSEEQRLIMEQLATRDSLTELANRRKFLKNLELAIANSKRTGLKVGVLYLDLNDFKILNDTHRRLSRASRLTSNSVLAALSSRMRQTT